MSAFLVDKCVIDYALTFATGQRFASVYVPSLRERIAVDHQNFKNEDRLNVDWIGAQMLRENIRSLRARYGNRAPELIGDCTPDDYRFQEHPIANGSQPLTAVVQCLKALACFDYQACETDDYDATDAAQIVRDLRGICISALPGWDAATWGAPAHPARRGDAPGGPVSLMSIMHGRA